MSSGGCCPDEAGAEAEAEASSKSGGPGPGCSRGKKCPCSKNGAICTCGDDCRCTGDPLTDPCPCAESLFRNAAETLIETLSSHNSTTTSRGGGGEPQQQEEQSAEILVNGMTCSMCSQAIQNAIENLQGVTGVAVSLTTDTAHVEWNSSQLSIETIQESIEDIGYAVENVNVRSDKKKKASTSSSGEGTTDDQSSENGAPRTQKIEIIIGGMTCTNCVQSAQNAIQQLGDNIVNVNVSLATDSAVVEFSNVDGTTTTTTTTDDITNAIEDVGYEVTSVRKIRSTGNIGDGSRDDIGNDNDDDDEDDPSVAWSRLRERQAQKVSDRRSAFLYSLIGTVPILLITMILPHIYPAALLPLQRNSITITIWNYSHTITYETILLWLLATPVQFVSGWEFYRMSYHGLKSGRAGMDLLVCLGTMASYFYAFYGSIIKEDSMTAHFFETSATLISFVLCGKWLQALAVRRTSQALSKLMQLQAKTAIKIIPINVEDSESNSNRLSNHDLPFDPLYDGYREETVPLREVHAGDIVKILRGASVPADGKVLFGEISVDESMVTGESIPVLKTPGSIVLGGTVCVEASLGLSASSPTRLNQPRPSETDDTDDALKAQSVETDATTTNINDVSAVTGAAFVQVTGVGSSTALAQIVQLVHDAQTQAVPIQTFADQIAGVFVPTVCAISLVTFLVWYILCRVHVVPASWYTDVGEDPLTFSIMFGLACLVISCPCALGLATPTAVMVGTGIGANNGVLMKGGEALEIASSVNTVVFDKTGTLTQGKPGIIDFIRMLNDNDELYIISLPNDELSHDDYLLWLLASLERTSEHPLAKAVVTYAETKLGEVFLAFRPFAEPTNFKAFTGRGASGTVDGHVVAAGNRAFAEILGINISPEAEACMTRIENEGKTAILASVNGKVCVVMGIADELKPDAATSIAFMRENLHVDVWMVTGDNKRTAAAISRQLKLPVNRVIAEAMPSAKVEQVCKLQDEGNVVCFVGDGINDSPALAQANLGLSIGTGTEIAAEASDMVLVKGHVEDVCTALHLSRAIFHRIQMNLLWSLFYNCLGIPIAAGVFFPLMHTRLPPTVAAIAMALSSISVVLSSLSLRLYKPPDISGERSSHGGVDRFQCWACWGRLFGRHQSAIVNETSALEESLLDHDQLAVV